jgi:hypothetical protein
MPPAASAADAAADAAIFIHSLESRDDSLPLFHFSPPPFRFHAARHAAWRIRACCRLFFACRQVFDYRFLHAAAAIIDFTDYVSPLFSYADYATIFAIRAASQRRYSACCLPL